jgi:hypothetical protein
VFVTSIGRYGFRVIFLDCIHIFQACGVGLDLCWSDAMKKSHSNEMVSEHLHRQQVQVTVEQMGQCLADSILLKRRGKSAKEMKMIQC